MAVLSFSGYPLELIVPLHKDEFQPKATLLAGSAFQYRILTVYQVKELLQQKRVTVIL
jgi:hypothetical protein